MRFKIKNYRKLSRAKTLRVRKRSTCIALGLEVLHLLLEAKTEEERESAIRQYRQEASMMEGLLRYPSYPKFPRKLKKKEKQKACDIFNAYALVPELVIFILSNRDEKESNQA